MDGATQMPMSEFEASRWHNSRVCVWCFHQTINKQPCASAYATPAPLQFVLTQGICWFPLRNELTQADATKGFAYASRKPLMTQLLQLTRQGGFKDAPFLAFGRAHPQLCDLAFSSNESVEFFESIESQLKTSKQVEHFNVDCFDWRGPRSANLNEIWQLWEYQFHDNDLQILKDSKSLKGIHFQFSYN